MAVATADIQTHVAELSDGSFEAFCEDISGMFGADVTCERQGVRVGAAKDLRKHFKKLTAVHHVEATGMLNGTYHLVFDQGGLFILSGVIVMLPERRIREEVKRGSADDAENLTDAAREVGNLLVGSWDRAFREDCEEHDHFLKTGTFIGKPWDDLSEVDLTDDTELVSVLYEMTVEPYPTFRCAALFPKTMIDGAAGSDAVAEPEEAPAAPAEPAAVEETPPTPAQVTVADSPAPVVEEPPEAAVSEPSAAPVETEPAQPVEQSDPPEAEPVSEPTEEPVAEKASEPVAAQIPSDIQSVVEAVVGDTTDVVPDVKQEVVPEVKQETVQASPAPVAEPATPPPAATSTSASAATFMDQILADSGSYPGDTAITDLLRTAAKDIMTTDVVWSAPEDTVQDVVAKMQQNNTGYVLIGTDGVLEGLVSNSNIMSAISPYLRPMFAKWRRPEDDATLEIKIKWMMSRPVRTVTPEATLGSMIESMRRYGGRCLPVVDSQGSVQGIITVFDILLRVLAAEKTFSWEGNPPQAPPLLI